MRRLVLPFAVASMLACTPARADDSRDALIVLSANPVLAPFGKWSARLEAAPFAAHALFVEASRLEIPVGIANETVHGVAVDLGYHLFPFGRRLDGPYVGPRITAATGDLDVLWGTLTGWGGDVGYQLVLDHVAVNVGVGAERAHVVAEPRHAALVRYGLPIAYEKLFFRRVERDVVLPVATLAVGIAF